MYDTIAKLKKQDETEKLLMTHVIEPSSIRSALLRQTDKYVVSKTQDYLAEALHRRITTAALTVGLKISSCIFALYVVLSQIFLIY